jgi:exodeoxyribonuclease-3
MKLATWNVNSIKVRHETVREWLAQAAPDLLLMQELKCETSAFPAEIFRAAGYEHIHVVGQKAYNGVAIVSRRPFKVVLDTLPGDTADEQSRYLEIIINNLHVMNIYLPNGNPLGTEKFHYKLAWLARLQQRLETLTRDAKSFIIMGDFNIIPEDHDCYNPAAWYGDALFQPESRAAYRRMLNLGLTDAVRMFYPRENLYTYWDYQGGAWSKNFGIRIDHILMSPSVADRCAAAGVDKTPRGKTQPSDHVPVWVELR